MWVKRANVIIIWPNVNFCVQLCLPAKPSRTHNLQCVGWPKLAARRCSEFMSLDLCLLVHPGGQYSSNFHRRLHTNSQALFVCSMFFFFYRFIHGAVRAVVLYVRRQGHQQLILRCLTLCKCLLWDFGLNLPTESLKSSRILLWSNVAELCCTPPKAIGSNTVCGRFYWCWSICAASWRAKEERDFDGRMDGHTSRITRWAIIDMADPTEIGSLLK